MAAALDAITTAPGTLPAATSVLLVGDSGFERVRIEGSLRAAGYHVECAASTADAVERAHRMAPDIILLDVNKHGLRRLVSLAALRTDRRLAPIPVVLVTAAGDFAALDLGLELGAADFVLKPVAAHDLLARLRVVLAARAEERRLKSAEALAARRSRNGTGRLAAASFEMRDALTPVAGFSALMLGETFGPLGDARYRTSAQGLAAATQDFLAMVETLDDIAKIESGELALSDEVVSLPAVIEAATRRVRPMADAKSLRIEGGSGAAIRLRGDENRLRRIVDNLLANAVKATPRGGTVRVYASESLQAGLRLVVEDNGSGISPADLSRIRASLGDRSRTLLRFAGEAEYGLLVAQALAALHGGGLEFESVPGQGTRASIVLPRERMLLAA
jgi:signal transduction histidine kinase